MRVIRQETPAICGVIHAALTLCPSPKGRFKTRSKNAIKIIDQMIGDDVELREMVAEEIINARVAQIIYDARKKAGLTQKQLADILGTKQPVIARLEDADYQGHSLSMLNRIANALNLRLTIQLTPAESQEASLVG